MEILSFDIKGKFAHFKKFYGNNTALSYSIPPRTTIIGILAALMGEEKDSYYETYRSDYLRVGIRVLSDLKKTFHRLNLLKITGQEDFTGRKGHIQTPFEIVTGNDLKKHSVKYRIYLAPGEDPNLFEKIKQNIEENEQKFNLTLGIANFSAFISNIRSFKKVKEIHADNEFVEIHSACNSGYITEIEFPDDPEFKFNRIEEELMPADFVGNNNREVFRMNRLLFSTHNFPMNVKLTGTYYQIGSMENEIENIQFMEYAGVFTQ